MTISTRIICLKLLVVLLLIAPGLVMISAPVTGLEGVVEIFLDFAYQPYDSGQPITGKSAHLLNAILGGVLTGFGVMIWQVAEHVMRKDFALARRLIFIPLLCWFAADSLGSFLAGAWFNAVINSMILALFVIALFWGVAETDTIGD